MDAYFSADVETDGPIPGPFSILSFSLVYAGAFDGLDFKAPKAYDQIFYIELKPISTEFQLDALRINGLDRERLLREGHAPSDAMDCAYDWVEALSGDANPVFVAYPLSFDWTWMYWYFIRFAKRGSPFGYSRCFDIKTAVSVKTGIPISDSGRATLPPTLKSKHRHTHNAVDDAIAQAEIFAKVFDWEVSRDRNSSVKKRTIK